MICVKIGYPNITWAIINSLMTITNLISGLSIPWYFTHIFSVKTHLEDQRDNDTCDFHLGGRRQHGFQTNGATDLFQPRSIQQG